MRILIILLMLVSTLSVAEEGQGYWELGAGLSYFDSPYYPGSDQSKSYVLPFPHIIIKSDKFSIHRDSLRGHILSSDRFKFDISFSGALKVDSEDSRLREGMPDLDYIIESGPAMKWLLSGRFNGSDRWTLDVPVRAAVSTDFNGMDYIGWRLLPTLHWHNVVKAQGAWYIDNRLQLQYSSREFHDYLYSVEPLYATPERPAYQAEEGFSGWQYRFTLRYRQGKRITGFYLAYRDIGDAAFSDSPLVARDYNVSGGVFVTWVLGQGTF